MDKRIIYQNEGGGLSVIIPAIECGLTVEEIAAKDVPQGVQFEIIESVDLPGREFRNAWQMSGAAVVEDVAKCKQIAHEKRRAARAVELAPLDIEATIPAKATQAEAKRQVIRDRNAEIQTSIDAAEAPEALKAIIAAL